MTIGWANTGRMLQSCRLIAVDNNTDWLVAVTVREHKCVIAGIDILL